MAVAALNICPTCSAPGQTSLFCISCSVYMVGYRLLNGPSERHSRNGSGAGSRLTEKHGRPKHRLSRACTTSRPAAPRPPCRVTKITSGGCPADRWHNLPAGRQAPGKQENVTALEGRPSPWALLGDSLVHTPKRRERSGFFSLSPVASATVSAAYHKGGKDEL